MLEKSFGFIGGGRVTRIILGGLVKKGLVPKDVFVSDPNEEVLNNLLKDFPFVKAEVNQNKKAAQADVVFLSLHPPVIASTIEEIKAELKSDAILFSLAPKITIAKFSELLNGFSKIVRVIPNSPSIIDEGFNPVAFSKEINDSEKEMILSFLKIFGDCPEVDEKKLEAYAVITAMGPTYFAFQINQLKNLAGEFGLTKEESGLGITKMLNGCLNILFNSELTPQQAMDLIPVKPIGDDEETIKNIFNTKLNAIYQKIRVN